MRHLTKLSFKLCLLCLVVLLSGCFGANNYPTSVTTWGDVTQKFIELEQEKAGIMEALRDKSSFSVANPSESG